MKTQISLFGAMLAALFAGSSLASAYAVDAAQSIAVDNSAPVRAILLPTVSIDATPATSESNPATMRIAETKPLEVTLLPTVHVTARVNPELAITLLPTVRVTPATAAPTRASARIADTAHVASGLQVVYGESPSIVE